MNRTLSALIHLAASVCVASLLPHAEAAHVNTATRISDAECAGAAPPSYVQGRIVERAAHGIDPLRLFVWRTRMIYQLDLMESVAWLDQRRALLAACVPRTARIEPGAEARQ